MTRTLDRNTAMTGTVTDLDCLFELPPMDPDFWNRVIQLKDSFIKGNIDPRQSSIIPREVAESWVECQRLGIDPYLKKVGRKLSANSFKKIVSDRKFLIDTATSYITKFKSLLMASEYLMVLTDEKGIVLYIEGSEKEQERSINILNAGPGVDMSERVTGTTAHSLCIRHRKPVQIIGPFNYCTTLQNNISSATPIIDENNEVIGTLVVVQELAKEDLQNLRAHSLGWVVSMGYAIENLLKVKKRNHKLRLMNATLETTLSLVDEGIVTLDKQGRITHINQEGTVILGASREEIIDKHYSNFIITEQSELIEDVFANGKPVQDFEIIVANKSNKENRFLLNIQPIMDNEEELKPKGAVIRLTQTDKVDKLLHRRGGTKATYTFADILHESKPMQKAIQIGKNIAGKEINVLLIGESGTGKELFAQAIHNELRPEGPFVALNCASMPRNLIESELFGYEGGAFTGAERKGRPGKIELANGGTLFLDEIGDMPLEIQPVLLRILEDKQVMRLGGTRYIPVDFRVVAATNKDLLRMVQEKRFREDLYYRLSIFTIKIPPLRERGSDILLLAEHFIEDICQKLKCEVPQLSPEVRKLIMKYSWPGNVRQLLNSMVYAVNMAQDGVIGTNDLPEEIVANEPEHIGSKKLLPLNEMEKQAIIDALKKTDNNTKEAARILGIGRTTIYRKLKEYGIENPDKN